MQYTDDPIADFNAWDKEQQDWLDSLPQCDYCKEPIQDNTYFEIEGVKICSDCLYDYCKEQYLKFR